MSQSFESGVLLGHVHTLNDGSNLRLRLARTSDFTALRQMLAKASLEGADLAAGRLVQFDPRQRYVICATSLVGSSETLLGVGSIRLGAAGPELLVLAEPAREEVRRRLEGILVDAAEASARAA